MPDPIPACFRGGAAASPAGAAGPSLTTSVYETHLGLVAFSWSRTILGLSLRAEIRLCSSGSNAGDGSGEDADEPLGFRVKPWLLWKRRGSKRFHLGNHRRHRCVDFAWDLSRARFSSGGSPEPISGFFVSVVLDGQMALIAGDLSEEAYKKTKAQRPTKPFAPKDPVLISRREHVVLGESFGRRSYKTTALFAGTEREISIELAAREKDRGGGEVSMWVGVDGKHVLHVRRLRWKFRGSEKVELENGGGRIQVSWDLHNWLFQPPAEPAPEVAGHAVFVFRFEGEEGHIGKRWGSFGGCKGALGEYFGKRIGRNWSESSSGGGGGGERRRRGKGRRKDLLKTSSSSSVSVSSTASSVSGSTVMDWASPEEVEMQRGEGFSLLVYAWKS